MHRPPKQPEPKQFNFPAVGKENLLRTFNDLGLSINDQEMSKPNVQVMNKFYAEFVAAFVHVEYGETGEPYDWSPSGKFMQLITEMCDYPELHRESMPHVMFFKELQLLIGRYVGISDFCMRDLIKPDPTRVRTIMSGLVNFLQFRELALESFEDLQAKSSGYEEQLAQAQQKNSQLRKLLQIKKQQFTKEKADAEQVEQENEELARNMEELHSIGNKSNAEYKVLKEKLKSHQDHLSGLVEQIDTKNEQIKLLESRIVSNPDEIKQSIVNMKALVQSLQGNIKEKESLSKNYSVKSESLLCCYRDLEKCMDALDLCGEVYRQFQDQTKQLQVLRVEAAKSETCLKDLNNAHHLQVRKQKAQIEKLARLAASFQEKAFRVQQKFDAGQEEYAAYLKSDQTATQISDLQVQCKEVKDKIVLAKEDFDDEMQHIQNEYTQLKESVMLYIADMKRAMSFDVQFGEL